MYYLVKFDKDWADEFSVYGFAIFEKLEWDNLLTKLKKNKDQDSGSWYFGTNEGWDSETIGDYLRDIEVVSITKDEKKSLERIFGESYFGHFPDFEQMLNKLFSEDE